VVALLGPSLSPGFVVEARGLDLHRHVAGMSIVKQAMGEEDETYISCCITSALRFLAPSADDEDVARKYHPINAVKRCPQVLCS